MLLLLVATTHSLLAARAPPAIKTLSPRSKALTVSVEYTGNLDDLALAQLSSSLRKVDAATLWTPSVASVAALYKEQNTAKGDFPGPCPVIFNGDSASVPEAITAGASAVVLSTVDLQTWTCFGASLLTMTSCASSMLASVRLRALCSMAPGRWSWVSCVRRFPQTPWWLPRLRRCKPRMARSAAGVRSPLRSTATSDLFSLVGRASATTKTCSTAVLQSRSYDRRCRLSFGSMVSRARRMATLAQAVAQRAMLRRRPPGSGSGEPTPVPFPPLVQRWPFKRCPPEACSRCVRLKNVSYLSLRKSQESQCTRDWHIVIGDFSRCGGVRSCVRLVVFVRRESGRR
jgi:hypothetical protein